MAKKVETKEVKKTNKTTTKVKKDNKTKIVKKETVKKDTNKKVVKDIKYNVLLNYGFNLKDIPMGTITVEETEKDAEKIKESFLGLTLSNDLGLLGRTLYYILEDANKKKRLKSIFKAHLVKKGKIINIFIKDFETGEFIKVGTIKNDYEIKSNKKGELDLEQVMFIIKNEVGQNEMKIAEMFFNLLANNDTTSSEFSEDTEEFAKAKLLHSAKRFAKITKLEKE